MLQWNVSFYNIKIILLTISNSFHQFDRFQNFPDDRDIWKEIERITASLRSEQCDEESELLVQMFQHIPQDLQHRLLIMTADHSEDTMEHCKLLLLLLRRFPQTIATHGVSFPFINFHTFYTLIKIHSIRSQNICFTVTIGRDTIDSRKTQSSRQSCQRLQKTPGLWSVAASWRSTCWIERKTEPEIALQSGGILLCLHPAASRFTNHQTLGKIVPSGGADWEKIGLGVEQLVRHDVESRDLLRQAAAIREHPRRRIERGACHKAAACMLGDCFDKDTEWAHSYDK